MTSSKGNLPERMYRRGRPAVQEFSPEEDLFRRCLDIEVADYEPFIDQIPFYPDMSVNRSAFSLAHDVLYPEWFDSCGVLGFAVGHIPNAYDEAGQPLYEWKPFHDPEDENYAHTEVRTYKDGVFDRNLRIRSVLVKKHFRERLREVTRVVIRPGEGKPD